MDGQEDELMTGHGRWQLDRRKYLRPEQSKQLWDYVVRAAEYDKARNRRNGPIAMAIIDLGLHAGLRVSEIANVRVSDCEVGYGQSQLRVRRGKGGHKGVVVIGKAMKRRLKAYIRLKKSWGEDISPDAYLLVSQLGGPFSRRGIQKRFKELAARAGLPDYFAVHCLRHSFGTDLLRQSKNLRLVQKQLRHASVVTTTVYADVCDEELQEAMDGLS